MKNTWDDSFSGSSWKFLPRETSEADGKNKLKRCSRLVFGIGGKTVFTVEVYYFFIIQRRNIATAITEMDLFTLSFRESDAARVLIFYLIYHSPRHCAHLHVFKKTFPSDPATDKHSSKLIEMHEPLLCFKHVVCVFIMLQHSSLRGGQHSIKESTDVDYQGNLIFFH